MHFIINAELINNNMYRFHGNQNIFTENKGWTDRQSDRQIELLNISNFFQSVNNEKRKGVGESCKNFGTCLIQCYCWILYSGLQVLKLEALLP